MCERLRAAIVDRLLYTPSASVYDFDDELSMARYAEAIWPDEATTRLGRSIEAERAALKQHKAAPVGL